LRINPGGVILGVHLVIDDGDAEVGRIHNSCLHHVVPVLLVSGLTVSVHGDGLLIQRVTETSFGTWNCRGCFVERVASSSLLPVYIGVNRLCLLAELLVAATTPSICDLFQKVGLPCFDLLEMLSLKVIDIFIVGHGDGSGNHFGLVIFGNDRIVLRDHSVLRISHAKALDTYLRSHGGVSILVMAVFDQNVLVARVAGHADICVAVWSKDMMFTN